MANITWADKVSGDQVTAADMNAIKSAVNSKPDSAGTNGTNGWSPIFAVVSDGARRVLQVTDWTGGTGTEPASPRYIGASGLTTVLADAIDIRGAEGSGGGGSAAWGDITGTITDQTDLTTRINALIAAVVDSAPGALDTLNELAAALGDDANFATTITNALALKAPLNSPAFTGTPTAPTATAGTDTTQVATTAFVKAAVDAVEGGGLDAAGVRAVPLTGVDTASPTEEPDAPTASDSILVFLGKLWAWVQWLFMLIGFLPKVYNVRRFGAVPNNAAIEFGTAYDACVAAMAANGWDGPMYVPAGRYYTARDYIATNHYYTQLPIPSASDAVPRVAFRMIGDGAFLRNGYTLPVEIDNTFQEKSATQIISTRTGSTMSGDRVPSIIGGPAEAMTSQASSGGGGISNTYVEIHGIIFKRQESNPTATAIDLRWVAQCQIGTVYTQTEHDDGAQVLPTNTWAAGILFPRTLNNALVQVDYCCNIGWYLGHNIVAHMYTKELFSYRCAVGAAVSTEGFGMHRAIVHGGIEHCAVTIASGWDPATGLTAPTDVRALDLDISIEGAPIGDVFFPQFIVHDPGNALYGRFRYQNIEETTIVNQTDPGISILGGANWHYENIALSPTLGGVTTHLLHTFTGSNSTSSAGAANTGQAESQLSGTWGIDSNKGYCVTTADGVYIDVWDSGEADGILSVDIDFTTNTHAFLIARAADVNNCIMMEVTLGSEILTHRAGVSTYNPLNSTTNVKSAGVHNVKMSLDGDDIICYVDNVQVMSYSTATGLEAETMHGIGQYINSASGATNVGTRFDNLTLTSLP